MDFQFGPQVCWLIIFAVMVVIELMTMGLTTIWFAGGALAALLVSFTPAGIPIQVALFLVVSLVLLMLIRPWARKHFNGQRVATNAQSLIGETAIVIEPIDNLMAKGRVSVRGQEWAARNIVDEPILKDEKVTVKEISGVKLIVEKQ